MFAGGEESLGAGADPIPSMSSTARMVWTKSFWTVANENGALIHEDVDVHCP